MNRFYTISVLFVILLASNLQAQWVKAYAGTDSHIDIINVDSMKVIATIPDGRAYRMVLTPDGKKLYTTDHDYGVQVIDTEAATILKAFDPTYGNLGTYEMEGIAISPDGSRVYVADESEDTIFIIDTSTDTVVYGAMLDLDEAEDIIVSPDGKYLYVNDNSNVSKIRTDSLIMVSKTYVGNDGHGISLSADGQKVYAQGQYNSIRGLVVLSADSLQIDTALVAGGYHVETSHDGTRVFSVDESNDFSVIDAQADTVLANPVYDGFYGLTGISETPDNDYILLAGNKGLLKVDATTLGFVDSTGYSYRTVVSKKVIPTAIGQDDRGQVARTMKLYNNYPNPFNPGTTIKYELPDAGKVLLQVYDIRGRLVETLIDGVQNAGEHRVGFDAGSLASGVYIYRLRSAREVQSAKMMLLR